MAPAAGGIVFGWPGVGQPDPGGQVATGGDVRSPHLIAAYVGR